MAGRYPRLSADLAKQLAAVPASGGLYRPCQVVLKDGSVEDRVYVVDAWPWFQNWGVWPEDDSGKSFLGLDLVDAIADSPSRLPARFADVLYAAGESGMGYTIFTIRFEDGTSIIVGTGNAIDFIRYPPGQSPATVAAVIPHAGRGSAHIQSEADYRWCLYDGTAPPE